MKALRTVFERYCDAAFSPLTLAHSAVMLCPRRPLRKPIGPPADKAASKTAAVAKRPKQTRSRSAAGCVFADARDEPQLRGFAKKTRCRSKTLRRSSSRCALRAAMIPIRSTNGSAKCPRRSFGIFEQPYLVAEADMPPDTSPYDAPPSRSTWRFPAVWSAKPNHRCWRAAPSDDQAAAAGAGWTLPSNRWRTTKLRSKTAPAPIVC